jgi:hypothetical protein
VNLPSASILKIRTKEINFRLIKADQKVRNLLFRSRLWWREPDISAIGRRSFLEASSIATEIFQENFTITIT